MKRSKQFLRPADLAPLLGLSRSRIYQMVGAGSLPAIRNGRAIWIPLAAWEVWLARTRDRALGSLSLEEEKRP